MRGNLSVTREAAFIGYQLCSDYLTFISFTFLRFSTLVWTLTWSEGCGSTSGATWMATRLHSRALFQHTSRNANEMVTNVRCYV